MTFKVTKADLDAQVVDKHARAAAIVKAADAYPCTNCQFGFSLTSQGKTSEFEACNCDRLRAWRREHHLPKGNAQQ